MKGEKDFIKAVQIVENLQKNYKKLGRPKVLIQHAKYLVLVRKAAYKGHVEAQFELGLNYEDQNYFDPNPLYNQQRRFYWYLKAAKGGHAVACNNLASLYEKGEGTKKDLKKALFFYKKAFELGCTYAKQNYEILISQLEGKL